MTTKDPAMARDPLTAQSAPSGTASGARKKAVRLRLLERTSILVAFQLVVLFAALGWWEFAAREKWISTFLFASPSNILRVLARQWQSGQLANDIGVTLMETLLGFIVGSVAGSAIGLAFWYSSFIARMSKPFIAAVGSVPVLAVAPLVIIWFGIGILSKVVIVAFSCVIVSLLSAYTGAQQVDKDEINLMRSFGATRNQIFQKVVVPSSMAWVISGLKLNIGFALIGAIVGEYVSSEAGVGHSILIGSANFSIDVVMAGLVIVMILVTVLNVCVQFLEKVLLPWKQQGKRI